MTSHLADAAAVVIPSHKEPWGVVAHEMAIAGLPPARILKCRGCV